MIKILKFLSGVPRRDRPALCRYATHFKSFLEQKFKSMIWSDDQGKSVSRWLSQWVGMKFFERVGVRWLSWSESWKSVGTDSCGEGVWCIGEGVWCIGEGVWCIGYYRRLMCWRSRDRIPVKAHFFLGNPIRNQPFVIQVIQRSILWPRSTQTVVWC